MSKKIAEATEQLQGMISAAITKAMEAGTLPQGEIPPISLEVPGDRAHGDWSTNIAMVGARVFKCAPPKTAAAIKELIELTGSYFERCEIAGPGFINFYLSPEFGAEILLDVAELGADYGKSNYGEGKKVLVEFVSANPTGPMHIGNARGGAVGDCLAAVLSAAGYYTQREFYVNDAGNQIEKFATSLETRYLQLYKEGVEMPEDAYLGEDIVVHAKGFSQLYGDKYVEAPPKERRDAMVNYALPLNVQGLRDDLSKYRISYDKWFLESELHKSGAVDRVIELLKERGCTYEQEGALWFKSTDYGNDKDVVLVRANGIPTYIVPDIAYHYNKLVTRGYHTAVDVLGADHHGYVIRMKSALKAIGIDPQRLNAVIVQMVRLVRDGEAVKLSKRSGKAITLSTLLEEVPIDSARFIFNLREPNSHCDFDLDLAISEDSLNPVYYVQYAHARICSILKALEQDGISPRPCTKEELCLLNTHEERELIRHISAYTDEIIGAAREYDPARITKYVHSLATLFHKFYNSCRVRGENESLMQARLCLCSATKTVICNVLTMLKVSVPESM